MSFGASFFIFKSFLITLKTVDGAASRSQVISLTVFLWFSCSVFLTSSTIATLVEGRPVRESHLPTQRFQLSAVC